MAAQAGRERMAQGMGAWLGRLRARLVRSGHALKRALKPALRIADRPLRVTGRWMPKGLYPRALVIVIAPVVLLQSVIAYVFMERHWQLVTQRLSSAVSADIAMIIDVYERYPQDAQSATLARIAQDRFGMDVDIIPDADLPAPGPRPFFSLLDNALSTELAQQVARRRQRAAAGRHVNHQGSAARSTSWPSPPPAARRSIRPDCRR